MPNLTRRALRYSRSWLMGPDDHVEVETRLDREGQEIPATVARPRNADGRLPGWVVLHGITRTGREHAQLVRFTQSLVSTGAVAIVPEVPEWRALNLAPHAATPTVRAGIVGLRETGWALDAPVAVIGFSFGAPHAIAAAGHADIAEHVAGTVGFGGYCELESTFRFLMTGEHDFEGRTYRLQPDPYGRWIVGANYLGEIGDGRQGADIAQALHELATYAGDLGTPAWDAAYDPLIARLRQRIVPERRRLFDLFAPPADVLPDTAAAMEIAEELATAARAIHPLLDPREPLGRVEHPTHILHGRHDRLIPCSEAPKIRAALAPGAKSDVTITRLFGHAGQESLMSWMKSLHELPGFLRSLRRLLDVA